MTAALDPRAARRKSSASSTAPRPNHLAPRSPLQDSGKRSTQARAQQISAAQTGAKQTEAKVVPLDRARTTRRPSVRTLPYPQPLPLWLRGLFALQQGSTLVTILLVVAGLGVYGWTVYTQQRWSDAYRQLERLQKRERQFLTTNEVLKSQLAEQAESPGVGLVPPDPNSTIFLSPAPLRPAAAPEVAPSPDTPIPARPLGY